MTTKNLPPESCRERFRELHTWIEDDQTGARFLVYASLLWPDEHDLALDGCPLVSVKAVLDGRGRDLSQALFGTVASVAIRSQLEDLLRNAGL
jgi:hypothetical protein